MFTVSARTVLVAAFALFALCAAFGSPAFGDSQLTAVHKPFSSAQWNELMRLRHSAIILPAYVPHDYRVVTVRVERNSLTLGGESYDVIYSDGVNTIDWYVANIEAGGDAPPASFRAQYDSTILGRGVVYSQTDIPDPLSGRRGTCWVTGTPESNRIAGEHYGISACGPSSSAQAVARVMGSMSLVSNRAPRAVNDIWPEALEKKRWVVWTLAKSGNRWVLDSTSYPEVDDPCSGNANYARNDAKVVTVRTYYEAWSDQRLTEAWNMLSAWYQHQNRHDAWLAEHTSVKDIGAVTLCSLGARSVAAEIWWVNK